MAGCRTRKRGSFVKRLIAIAVAGVLLPGAAAAGEHSTLKAWGSMYGDLGVYHVHHGSAPDTADFGGENRLMLTLRGERRGVGKVESGVDVILPYGVNAAAYESLWGDTAEPPPGSPLPLGGAPVFVELRTFYLSFYLPFADVLLGRQIVNFGKGMVFSPVDVFTEVELTDLNLRRRGSDVAAVRVPLGALGGLDAVGEFPSAYRNESAALRLFGNLFGFDLGLTGIYRHRDTRDDEAVIGMGFKGDAVLGVYGEIAQHIIGELEETFTEAMLGADYSIGSRWYFSAEYLYSGAPAGTGSRWGRHNAYGVARYRINDLMNITVSALHSSFEGERSMTYGTLQYYYNILQNVDATAYIRAYRSSPGGMVPGQPDAWYGLRFEVSF